MVGRWLGVACVAGVSLLAWSITRAETTAQNATSPGNAPSGSASLALRSVLQVPSARVAELRNQALSETLERELLRTSLAVAPAAQAASAYYERFADRYVAPEAIEVWRILVGSEEQAKALLAEVKASATPQKTWSLAARQHSLDKATHFRKGYLGFVRADGSTDVPQVRVSPAIFAAALPLEDGALGEAPFREGEHWALVWRRGYRKAERRTMEQARGEMAQQLALAAARTALTDLLATLRTQHVTDYHPELVEGLPASPDEGFRLQRPSRQARPAASSPTPRQTDWGER